MKLWLLDADIIIDFLSHDVLDKLVKLHEIHAASSVIDEVKFFKRGREKYPVSFRENYIQTGLIKECSATANEASHLLSKLPRESPFTLHPGEIESLAILTRETNLIFCTCDAATIRTLPFLDLKERGISAETLLKKSGLFKPGLQGRQPKNISGLTLPLGKNKKYIRQKVNPVTVERYLGLPGLTGEEKKGEQADFW